MDLLILLNGDLDMTVLFYATPDWVLRIGPQAIGLFLGVNIANSIMTREDTWHL